MTQRPSIGFTKIGKPSKGTVIVLSADTDGLSEAAKACDPASVLERAGKVAEFKGSLASSMEVLAPTGTEYDRLVAIGAGKTADLDEDGWRRIGGSAFAAAKKASSVTLVLDVAGKQAGGEDVANVALGMLLRSYAFDKYKTKKNGDGDGKKPETKPAKITIMCSEPAAAKRAFESLSGVGEGVLLARDLVNEPANVLGPVEFAEKAAELESLGVKVEILTEKEMKKLDMGALLGVAQGSARPPRLVVMQWNGGKAKDKPVAFVGKGVVFDSGGISIKPAASMEDMKGDMAGAACVVGAMHALAARKAKANVVGIIGLVENMPDGRAQRPGDIVETLSGQTVEIINTDAEGRLVLADLLTYVRREHEPHAVIDFATLTGAIIVALGQEYAGLFCNDDALAGKLLAAGEASGDKLWRMPLGPAYDKQIDSKFADMKNTGGRNGGAITAAQFLKRFVEDTPWAHVDLAGTAMAAPQTDVNKSWGSGYGVRLVDRLVRDAYEG